jgi:hypothetical protein
MASEPNRLVLLSIDPDWSTPYEYNDPAMICHFEQILGL